MRMRPIALGLAVLALSAGTAQAQFITWSGTTQGCFGGGCTPGAGPTTLGGGLVTFTNGSFLGTTNGVSFTNITGSPTNNFGQITVGTAPPPGIPVSSPFNLEIIFSSPNTGNQLYNAIVSGTVTALTEGGVNVDFNPGDPLSFAAFRTGIPFHDPLTNSFGNFSLLVQGGPIQSGQTDGISGTITVQNIVPEPATMTLLGTGLLGLLGMAHRRRRRAADLA